ncbi:hypothetical protein [Croceicoccus gelatinilyticus]|uniref:hypothetical protein n=1 Tax=Croceicoccus gelatinilyticus TaxID=2835536 RepID=UPI001BD0AAA7|nr:hypothetical protein [Croceicoccus gelatinilyticus]MBS7668727.1 hypothetical protein [Croceicoccus gelatinilyticus]
MLQSVPSSVLAQPAASPEASASDANPAQVREAQIRDLIEGELDPAVSAVELLQFSLTGKDGLRLRVVSRLIRNDDLFDRASDDPAILESISPEQAQLALAEATFLRLPQDRRERLLKDHAAQHQEYRKEQNERQSQADRVARFSQELAALRDFLDGKPANPAFLTANPAAVANLQADNSILSTATPQPGPEPAVDAPVEQRIAWLRAQVLLAKRKIVSLPADELFRLTSAAGLDSEAADRIAIAEAKLDEARMQLNSAEQAALDAASEHERIIASERARLLQVKKAQAQFRADLAQRATEPDRITEEALSWRRRIMASADRPADETDDLYDDLVDELSLVRRRLREALNRPVDPGVRALQPPALDNALQPGAPETQALTTQARALGREADALRAAYANQLWEERAALRNAMALLNDARLAMLASISPGKRSRVTGFGSEGVAQVRREIAEIVLEVRFNLQSWQRTLTDLSNRVARPSPGFVLSMLRILVLILAFAWWRRRGDAILLRAQREAANQRPRTMARSVQTAALRIWRGIRKPLDWLVLVALLWWLLPEELALTGSDFIWIILFWSLATFTLIRLVNELAKGRGKEDPRAALRWKSLKLLAGSLLVIGLLLNLTRASVGRGAIYSWVQTSAWILVPVVAMLLAHWWRARIVTLAKAEAGDSALLRWVGNDPGGIGGNVARILVGVVLLLKGLRAIMARRIRDVALVREMLDQRARLVAEKQVAEDKASGRFHRIPAEVRAYFDPHRLPATLRLDDSRPGYSPVPDIPRGSLTLIVGERGLGKSSILHDVTEKIGDNCEVVALEVPGCPGPDYLAEISEKVMAGEGNADRDVLVVLDDIQRLIVPAIGGLGALDRLITMARESGPNYRWIFTVSDASWRFLQRARSDRILFDAMISLPHWTAGEIRALIERRTEQAGIDPDFSDMVDDGVFEFGEEVSPLERRKRGYFERLTEYVSGNPAIALDYWQQSLFVDGRSGTITVRTFDTPPVEKLAALPMPALFVLRALLQMDFANADMIRASTDLSAMQVTDALRRLERIGTVVCHDGKYQIALHWWMEAVRLLARQNLIVREKS